MNLIYNISIKIEKNSLIKKYEKKEFNNSKTSTKFNPTTNKMNKTKGLVECIVY